MTTSDRARDQLRLGFESGTVAVPPRERARDFADVFERLCRQPPEPAGGSERVTMTWMDTPIGPMVAGATAKGVCLLEFSDRQRLETQISAVRNRFRCDISPGDAPQLDRLRAELEAYFSGTLRRFTLPLDAPGTAFEERVWAELLRIPYGETRSYESLALTLGSPAGQRAVGRANGLNPIAIVIPCHRVVNKNGRLGGYGGGLWRKELLLRLEQTGQPLTRHA